MQSLTLSRKSCAAIYRAVNTEIREIEQWLGGRSILDHPSVNDDHHLLCEISNTLNKLLHECSSTVGTMSVTFVADDQGSDSEEPKYSVIAAEAYQVIGVLADELGYFNGNIDEKLEREILRALDYFSALMCEEKKPFEILPFGDFDPACPGDR